MTSESLRGTSPRRSPTPVPPRLQLPNGKEVSEILQQMCSEVSQSTTAEIVEIANSADSRSKLQDLMPVYFYSWQLQSLEAVITHLLLHYFILWRECSELRGDKQVFEEHIERLKGRVGELEEIKGPNPEIGRLTKQVRDLKMKNEKLQNSHDELCHINSQWALDYESLTQKMSANSTGCYSIPSTSSQQHFSICTQCPQLEREIGESQSEVHQLTTKLEKLQRTIDQRNQEVEHLENENRAIQFQLQEIGDLQVAMKIKQDYSKLEIQHRELKRQHQDTVCQRMQLNQQVEKLRRAFLQLFPFGSTSTVRSGRVSVLMPGGHLRQACRMHQYYSDPGPPTPPGLIARGDHRGSLVEKDIKPPRIHIDEQVTGFERSVPHLDDFHTWHGATSTNDLHMQFAGKRPRPRSLFQPTVTKPSSNGVQGNVLQLDHLECHNCSKIFGFNLEEFDRWFDHIRYCGV